MFFDSRKYGKIYWVKFRFSENAIRICEVNLPRSLDIYLVNVQTMKKIAQIIGAFSEKLNFNQNNYKGLYVA